MTLSCDLIKTSSGSKSQLQGNTAGGSNGASFAPPGGDYVVGDPESIRAFNQWTDRERALMIVSADNGIYYGQNPMNPRGLPYVKVQRDSADVREYLQIHPRQDAIQRQYKKLSHKFSADQCSQDILIPYHPDTKSQHYRIEMLKKQGKIVDFQNGGKGFYDGLAGFNSMSRSLFVLNDNGNDGLPILFSLKVGSDTVMGTYQSEKLNNVHWNARYVNSLSEPTSIHELAEDSGIGLVSDSVGLVYGGDYGAVLRDYSLLVAEKDYFFMPLMSFQEKLIKKNSPSSQEDTYFWNIYKPARLNI